MDIKKYLVEVLGTMTLTLVVALSIVGKFPVPTPVVAALCLGLFVYTIGHISGAHINPAITIGAWVIKKISTNEAISYIIAQFVGAVVAAMVVAYTVGFPVLTASNTWITGFAELLGAFFFAFGVASVVYGRTPSLLSGVVVGGSLLLGITISASLGANGILNPAVAFGIKSLSAMYILAPIIGCVLGMWVYKYLNDNESIIVG
jgi:glycerol uptake facilitator-like aquaporin